MHCFWLYSTRERKKISVIGINRDTMASMNVYDKNGRYSGRQTAQIALSHAYGDGLEESCENSLDAVSNLFYGLRSTVIAH